MKVVLFGGTGMIGQGVLRECLLAPEVTRILSVVRTPSGERHQKLTEIVPKDFFDLSPWRDSFKGYDACFFCLGVSSVGRKEKDYRRLTYDLTVKAADVIAAQSPGLTWIYVSGSGTDSSEKGKRMWARVKGETENALAKKPFRAVYFFRLGAVQPLRGIRSKTPLYQALYTILRPLTPVFRRLLPRYVTTTELVARAMIEVVRRGSDKRALENDDINRLGARGDI